MVKGVVLEYQLQNRVENLADVSTRCSGLLQGEDASGRNVGKVFNPVLKLVFENYPFLMPEPAEKPSLQDSGTVNVTGETSAPFFLTCKQCLRLARVLHFDSQIFVHVVTQCCDILLKVQQSITD